MLPVEEVCKHSDIYCNPSIQHGHECFAITGMVNPCYVQCLLSSTFDILLE